ncbi:MAG: metallophosphoesterase [Methanocalculus sp.]|uniref:metallophosphoesterase n=1 Tax=Methanocalculus sp. TaxID=2004547 RepID=UPI002715729B|nr:metallophosphoesterase [Methanocalculus sp.]MDO8841803.1 metallophosphoesterase [Methanocalculus sp.]MDO9540531.1 metallophosphoesterase [Methanocalculus sp.]
MIQDLYEESKADQGGELNPTEDTSTFRLDLKLGVPHSKLQGALEWWTGDSGLCLKPDHHPYLVAAEISAGSWCSQEDIMQAISRGVMEAGPVQVLVNSVFDPEQPENVSLYQIYPSPGLRSFLYRIAQICPVHLKPGSLIDSISRGVPAPFILVPPLNALDPILKTCRRIEGTKPKREIYKDTNPSHKVHNQKMMEYDPVPIEILRMVLRRDTRPVAEYDLFQNIWLTPLESILRKNAISSLREFRIRKGFQMNKPHFEREKDIYIISDLHLGHTNSIPRYNRPFMRSNPDEMDRVLIRNWNWTVKKRDTVIFLGDLAYRSSIPSDSYLDRLNGRICYLEGNHDPYQPYMSHCLLMCYKGVSYLFIHDPDEVSKPFDGWVIHGHVHNKNLSKYPFFNPHTQTVNVSAEMIGYRPITMTEIHNLVTEVKETISFREIPREKDSNQNLSDERVRYIHTRDYHACQV